MKFRNTGRALVAVAALSMVLGLSACSGGDDKPTDKTTTAVSASTVPLPTAEEMNQALKDALGEDKEAGEQVAWIEGAEDDPDLLPNLKKSAKDSGAQIDITDVTDTGLVAGNPTAQASGSWTLNGQENPLTVPFIYLDGHWKVSKDWTCQMLQAGNMTSKICDAA